MSHEEVWLISVILQYDASLSAASDQASGFLTNAHVQLLACNNYTLSKLVATATRDLPDIESHHCATVAVLRIVAKVCLHLALILVDTTTASL